MRLILGIVFGNLFSLSNSYSQEGTLKGADILERAIQREAVPAAVLADAVNAVQQVGEQTLKGQFEAVIAQLYPRYRQRAAKKLGGSDQLAVKMEQMVDEFAAGGLTVTQFVAEPALHGFDIPEFGEWLVFVPTTRTVRFIDPNTGQRRQGEIGDYQIAVRSKKEGSSWTFINGSLLKIQELRSFFPSLPVDIQEYAVPKKSFRELP